MSLHYIKFLFLAVLIICASTGCEKQSEAYISDPHSYALPNKARVTHLELDIELDFKEEVIIGTAILSIDKEAEVQQLRLDTKDLTIYEVKISDDGGKFEDTEFLQEGADPVLGSALLVELKAQTRFVSVRYSTSPQAEALQWLPPELTAEKKSPFLLTQSQAINARTWVPIQDSPGIRFTYHAKVKAPSGMMVVMSANNPTEPSEDGVYEFEMKQPIPAYLLALAAGDFVFASLGSRTGVYAEGSKIQAAAYEFAELEEMMQIAEQLYGPYRWERYDIIVLPPSFPFGGMENPRLTFATPTILAGDRSLVSLVAHELAHSWSGNLVTNATWNDFWLNEGFTVYFEHRIMEGLKGREYSEMLAELAFQDLAAEVVSFGPENSDTHLKLDLQGRHPDDGMTAIAYDKGYYFLRLVEETVGREKFDEFLRNYFEANAFKTMTTEQFLALLDEQLLSENEAWSEAINIDSWVYGPGVPENVPRADAQRFAQVDATLTSSMAGEAPENLETNTWSTHEWLHFIRHLPDSASKPMLEQLDGHFKFTQSTNSEIQCAWYTKAITNEYEDAYPAIKDFLVNVGRRKFLMPLYRAMLETPEGRERAMDIYEEARANYHPISVMSLDELLEWKQE